MFEHSFKIVYLETSNLLLIFAYGRFCENMVQRLQGVLDCVSLVPEVRHTPMIGDAARPKCQKRTLYEQRKVCAALQVSERRGANSKNST